MRLDQAVASGQLFLVAAGVHILPLPNNALVFPCAEAKLCSVCSYAVCMRLEQN